MAEFYYLIDSQGRLKCRTEKKEKKKEAVNIMQFNDDDEDEWDIPSLSFDDSSKTKVNRDELTADFQLENGVLTLLRWPRLRQPAVLPEEIEGVPLTKIAPTAFAKTHFKEKDFAGFYSSPINFSVFCMKNGKLSTEEELDEDGPTEIFLPETVEEIGEYAFYGCRNLVNLTIPSKVTALKAGACAECIHLTNLHLPAGLKSIGYSAKPFEQVFPDTGCFYSCIALKNLTLPAGLQTIGTHTFNSSGITHLSCVDTDEKKWSREIETAVTAFDHTGSLIYCSKVVNDKTIDQVALPAYKDKISVHDAVYGPILRVPYNFFNHSIEVFDQLAMDAFRLDFSGCMAMSRLKYDTNLSKDMEKWYVDTLVKYFFQADRFIKDSKTPYSDILSLIRVKDSFQVDHVNELLRLANENQLPIEVITELIEIRNTQFSTMMGFEDLDLDF